MTQNTPYSSTTALILVAGKGSRLYPLTQHQPKCLVPFLNKPILHYQLEAFATEGIQSTHLVTGYQHHLLQEFSHTYNPQFSTTNMVSSLFCAEPFMQSITGDLLLSYGDIIYQQSHLQSVLSASAEISIMVDIEWEKLWQLRFDNPLEDAETLRFDEQYNIQEIGKKPKTIQQIQGQYTGLFKVRQDKIKDFIAFYHTLNQQLLYDGQHFTQMYMTSFLQCLIDAGWQVQAVPVYRGWLEFDSVSDFTHYEQLATTQQLDSFIQLT